MTVFYRGQGAFITHEVFQALLPDHKSFTIRELAGVHIVDHRQHGLFGRLFSSPLTTGYELCAFYHGHLVCLFRSPDERVFGQVARALRRAVEFNGLA
jgi:hypothetical protein